MIEVDRERHEFHPCPICGELARWTDWTVATMQLGGPRPDGGLGSHTAQSAHYHCSVDPSHMGTEAVPRDNW